jgi:Phage Mu protein F like protein
VTDFAASFGKPFRSQVAAFRLRLGDLRDTAAWTDIWQAEHDRAFMVAGATKAGILSDLAALVDQAVSQGTGLQAFRRDFRALIADKGWLLSPAGQGTKGGEAWRTKVIYRTNMATSYAAGRYAQLVEAGFPLWVYRHGGSLEPREQHLAWDGLILPPDHPFWATHAPPNGWGCSCYIVGARTMEGAKRLGGKPELTLPDNWQAIDPRTGAPVGIDKGWAYAPGGSVARTINAIAERVVTLPSPTGAQLVAEWPERFFRIWAESFGEFVDTVEADLPRGRYMVVGALKPAWVQAATVRGVKPASAEIAVLESDVRHTFRQLKKRPLDPAWYRELPVHLRNPDAVILDRTVPDEPALLLLYATGQASPKIVIRVNFVVRKVGTLNIVKSGQIVDTSGITPGPNYEVIEGSL